MRLPTSPKLPSKLKEFFSPAGTRKQVVYKYEMDEKLGCPVRVPNGFIDLDDFIQQSADDIDFKALGTALIGADASLDGVNARFRTDAPLVDISGLPKDVHQLSAMHNKLKQDFDNLPADLQNLFDNDYSLFIDAARKGTIGKTINDYYTAQQQPAADSTPAAEPTGGNE